MAEHSALTATRGLSSVSPMTGKSIVVAAALVGLGIAVGLLVSPRETGAGGSQAAGGSGSPGVAGRSGEEGAGAAGRSHAPVPGPKPDPRAGGAEPGPPVVEVPVELADAVRSLDDLDEDTRGEKILEIAREWLALDPAGALAWAFTLGPGQGRVVAGLVLREWSASDPAASLAAVRALGASDPRLRGYCERLIFGRWAASDAPAAWEAAGTIANPGDRIAVEEAVLNHWSETDPVATAAVLDSMAASPGQLEGLGGVIEDTAGQLALTDTGAAANWVESLPEGSARNSAVAGLVGGWLMRDFDGAAAWLGGLEAGAARDAGIDRLVQLTRNRDPQTALDWAAATEDARQRSRLGKMVALSWMSRDPEGARAAIERSPSFTPEDRDEIWRTFREMRQE
jgi:hypothetical protein